MPEGEAVEDAAAAAAPGDQAQRKQHEADEDEGGGATVGLGSGASDDVLEHRIRIWQVPRRRGDGGAPR